MIRKKGIELGLLVLLLAALLLVSGKKGQKEADGEGGYVETAGKAEESVSEDAGEEELAGRLHAQAAVLLDMDSGRVLFEKNGSEVLPMASTTKIMTCILALEEGNREDVVTISAYAAGQPKVHLGMQKGAAYTMNDLLYSLMLESHNDSAVAIAEHIGADSLNLPEAEERTREQSREAVQAFCDRMTEKAREIGCENTCFLTPNGLDAEVESESGMKRIHSTTAEELAAILRYCVTQSEKKEAFLEITQAPSYSFSDRSGKRSHTCVNHNALLTMMDGALTGKTGFTNNAGYCYVGALEKDGKRFALALLACGWPNHKTWKWADCKNLFGYGLEQYECHEFMPETTLSDIPVLEGASESGSPYEDVSVSARRAGNVLPIRMLTKQTESVEAQARLRPSLEAPVEEGMRIGSISYYLTSPSGLRLFLAEEEVYAGESVKRVDFPYVFRFVWGRFLIV